MLLSTGYFIYLEPKKTSERSHIFGRSTTPAEELVSNEHGKSWSGKSFDAQDTKQDDYESELADLNTSHETSTIANIVGDTSFDNSLQEAKPSVKSTTTKYSYGSGTLGKSVRSGDRHSTHSGYKSMDHRTTDKPTDLAVHDDRPDSRHSSISSFSYSQPVSYHSSVAIMCKH